MTTVVLQSLIFFLPAGLANMAPPIANKIPYFNKWNTPLDFGLHFHGKRIFGENKRWRGLISGVLMAGFIGLTINLFWPNAVGEQLQMNFVIGLALGLGALVGDAIESFFKRQVGVQPGRSWFPFDQIDYIVGGLIICYPLVHVPLNYIFGIFVIYFGLHLIVSYLGYRLGFKESAI